MSSVTAYPLSWPFGVPRTPRPQPSRFDRRRSFEQARKELFTELNRLGTRNIILSTNLQLRADGYPYSNRRQPEDKGVAVYFTLKGVNYCLPCDKWDRIECNCYAIAMHIDSMRGQQRWGVGSIEQSFKGYQALPEPGSVVRSWREVIDWDMPYVPDPDELQMLYRRLAKKLHPDNGGSHEGMSELNRAYEDAKRELGYE